MREPFNMTFAAIADCTDEQIERILFHPRHKDGTLDIGQDMGTEGEREESDSSEDEWSDWTPAEFHRKRPEILDPSLPTMTPFRAMVYGVWQKRDPSVTVEQMNERFRTEYPRAE